MSAKTHTQIRVPADALRQFAERAFVTAGVEAQVAQQTARALWLTSLRGVDSHGMRLLPHYIASIEGGRLNPTPNFVFEQTAASTGRLDADHGLGHAAGMQAMRHAIQLAKEAGVGFVSVYNSSHCGALATYALEACEHDMLGMAYTHATARMRTPNGRRAFLGTNPICFAAPMANEEPFCFDSAPTPFSFNKVKQYRQQGVQLPPDVAADKDGYMTQDPNAAEQLLPIGDYKGFGLSLMVDILCGLLTGMPVGGEVSNMFGDPLSKKRYLGHFFGAIRIDAFEDVATFKTRMQKLADDLRSEPALDTSIPMQVAGDPEKRTQQDYAANGIPLFASDVDALNALGVRLGIGALL
ncbi:MAG TPA: Ldh family oxidoreductase [Anaerolineales bacterium]|nr:Ldh family oxidoreductase [Anaerolineales bacterium]HRQ92539.1 Ldh family oxidoreductase [Anaerolineales bacterium]